MGRKLPYVMQKFNSMKTLSPVWVLIAKKIRYCDAYILIGTYLQDFVLILSVDYTSQTAVAHSVDDDVTIRFLFLTWLYIQLRTTVLYWWSLYSTSGWCFTSRWDASSYKTTMLPWRADIRNYLPLISFQIIVIYEEFSIHKRSS